MNIRKLYLNNNFKTFGFLGIRRRMAGLISKESRMFFENNFFFWLFNNEKFGRVIFFL